MTNHPALQPVLAAGNVEMLKKYIDALTPPDGVADGATDDYRDGYHAGYRAAARAACHLVHDMWSAAVIATDAVNLEMRQDIYRDETEDLTDDDDD